MTMESGGLDIDLELLAVALNNCRSAVEISDIDGTVRFVNPTWSFLFNVSWDNAVGADWKSLDIEPGTTEVLANSWDRCITEGHAEGIVRLQSEDGRVWSVSFSRALHSDADGATVSVVTNYEQSELPQQSLSGDEITDAAIDPAPAILTLDESRRIIEVSSEFSILSGYTVDQAAGRPFSEYFSRVDPGIWDAVFSGYDWSGESELLRSDGSSVPVFLIATAIPASNTNVYRIVIRVAPLHAEPRDEESEETPDQTQRRSVHHRLRNLLSIVNSNIQVMQGETVEGPTRRRLDLIHQSIRDAISLLDTSRPGRSR